MDESGFGRVLYEIVLLRFVVLVLGWFVCWCLYCLFTVGKCIVSECVMVF